LEEPLYVSYKLSKGGGDCNRSKFKFKNDTKLSLADDEYTNSGFDRGHLANAEDFANDCKKDELTFRYYNCLPQTPNMNRGVWKITETEVRSISQKEDLLIVCGGIWQTKTKKKGMYIPDMCWKVVYSYKQSKVIKVVLYTNKDKDSTSKNITLSELEKMLGYKVPLKY
jgi:endonuclease G